MKNLLTILFFIITPSLLWAQEFNIKLSEKHLNKVEQAESGREKLKKYRKYYQKDSSKQAKKIKKYWEAKSDSLQKARHNQYKEQLAKGKEELPDSTATDSLKQLAKGEAEQYVAENETLNKANEGIAEGKGALEKAKTLQNKDSLKATAQAYGEKGAQRAENEAAQQADVAALKQQENEVLAQQKQLEQYSPTEYTSKLQEQADVEGYKEQLSETANVDQYKNQAEQYTDQEQLKEKGKQQAKEKAINFFETKADVLKPAQKKLAKLQQKYRSVANSEKLDKAIKRNSLEGKPFKERLYVGGYFNVNSTDPLSLDLSPKLGYKINRKWVVGVGGTYRRTFGNDTLATNLNMPNDGYGYSAFSSYDAVRGFFVYGEYERMVQEIKTPEASNNRDQWVDALMLGLGRKLSVHRMVNMDIVLLYNFLHDPDNALYSRPWTIKVGFSLSELAMLKK